MIRLHFKEIFPESIKTYHYNVFGQNIRCCFETKIQKNIKKVGINDFDLQSNINKQANSGPAKGEEGRQDVDKL